jgi:hypothetical protein
MDNFVLKEVKTDPTSFYREVLTFVYRFTALRFTATGAPPAARLI